MFAVYILYIQYIFNSVNSYIYSFLSSFNFSAEKDRLHLAVEIEMRFFFYFHLLTSRWLVTLFARKRKLDAMLLKGHDSVALSNTFLLHSADVTLRKHRRASWRV